MRGKRAPSAKSMGPMTDADRARFRELNFTIARGLGRRTAALGDDLPADVAALPLVVPRPKKEPGRARPRPTDVYRLYDAAGVLLYVGISMSVAQRLGQHRHRRWWGDVARIEKVTLPSRNAALTRERRWIRELRPVHNLQGAEA